MKKSTSRVIAALMLIAAVGFLLFAFAHPEWSFPWSNSITYFLYVFYVLLTAVLFIAPFKKK